MEQNNNIADELLARYMADTASADEKKQVEDWLLSEANQKEFERYQKIWEVSSQMMQQPDFDTTAAWQEVKAQIETLPWAFKPAKNKYWWVAAASVLLILGASWFVFNDNNEVNHLAVKDLSGRNLVLSDSSKIYTNEGGSIALSDNFNEKTREVTLNGEAFFDIKRDENKPFIVRSRGVEVTVLGTSFNVDATNDNVEVSVKTGRVEVKRGTQKILLKAGEAAVATKDSLKPIAMNFNAMAYHTKLLMFDKTRLDQVVRALSKSYQTDVQLANKNLAECQLTANFDHENLQTTLSVIAQTLNLNIKKEGKTIWIDGAGCK